MSERSISLYLDDILSSIEHIEEYVKGLSFDNFKNDAKTIDAVVRNIEIIGEAAAKIPPETRLHHPETPWKKIIGARNKVIHEYFGIDVEILWKTIQEDIPLLKEKVSTITKADPTKMTS
ncbi:MAG: DUF86 domain-containing protein [Patescibacteria group bacterium]